MKTRLLIIIGISAGVLTLLFSPNEEQNICEQMGGIWNTDYCIVTQEMVNSNNVRCEPGPVLENGSCSSNGIKLVFESVVEPEPIPESEPVKIKVCRGEYDPEWCGEDANP